LPDLARIPVKDAQNFAYDFGIPFGALIRINTLTGAKPFDRLSL